MTASLKQREVASQRRQRAWELFTNGADQWLIAQDLGITEARVSQYIKQAAASNPVVKLSYDERSALAEAKWNQGEAEIREEIALQRKHGRVTKETITFPDGSVQVKLTTQPGVDPALLRNLSTHTDRRNRQAQNQLAPDTNVQAVNVNLVKDFLSQGDAPAARLTPEQWNETVDVTPNS